MRRLMGILTVAVAVTTAGVAAAPPGWPQFRGPGGAGVADGATLPERWSTTDNVAWAAEIPGRGWSSPIVWGDRVFVTSAVNANAFKAPSTGIFGNDYAAELEKQGLSEAEILKRLVGRDIELASESGDISYMVIALDAKTGKVVVAARGASRHRRPAAATARTPTRPRRRSPTASGSTPRSAATSASSATRSTASCCGTHTWAPQPIYLDFGTASSPVVHDGRVYQLHDNDGESFLAALDAKTGEELWNGEAHRSRRHGSPRAGRRRSSGSTTAAHRDRHDRPRLRHQLRHRRQGAVAAEGADAVDAEPGRRRRPALRRLGIAGRSEPPAGRGRPGASGDISLKDGETSNAFVAWRLPRFSGYTPSPLAYRGRDLRRQRQRRAAGRRRQDRRRGLQGAHRRRRSHVLELADRQRRAASTSPARTATCSCSAPATATTSWRRTASAR